MNTMSEKTKKMTTVAMMCALSYVATVVGRIPIVLFLKYDPKDVIIAIGGFIFGPLTSVIITVIVSFVEMFTISDTGIIGFIMNVIATCGFACVASYIYKKKHTLWGAVTGLLAGALTMTVLMLLWNYMFTPIYMGYPRETVAEMLIPFFLPFNLLKGGINMALTLLIYKPVVNALRRSNLIPSSRSGTDKSGRNVGTILVAGLLLATCVFFALVMKGVV